MSSSSDGEAESGKPDGRYPEGDLDWGDLYELYVEMLDDIASRNAVKVASIVLRVVLDSRLKHKRLSEESFKKCFLKMRNRSFDYEHLQYLRHKALKKKSNESTP